MVLYTALGSASPANVEGCVNDHWEYRANKSSHVLENSIKRKRKRHIFYATVKPLVLRIQRSLIDHY